MAMNEFLGALATLIAFVSYVPYVWTIINGRTRPHAFSWFVWGLLTVIAFIAQVTDNAGPGAWVTGFTAAVCFLIVGLSLWKGKLDATKTDWMAFAGALAAIPLWLATKDPLSAVILITIIDALGFYPTFRKAWHKPHEELMVTFFLSGLKFAIAIAALDNLTLVTWLYPASLVLMNWVFIMMVVYCRKTLSHAAA